MSIILDTSILIAIERGNPRVLQKLRELSREYPAPPQLTFMNYAEYLFGIQMKSPKNQAKARAFVNKFVVLPTTRRTGELLAELKRNADAAGTGLDLADLLIASQTIENQGILVTTDTDFTRIEGLKHVLIA